MNAVACTQQCCCTCTTWNFSPSKKDSRKVGDWPYQIGQFIAAWSRKDCHLWMEEVQTPRGNALSSKLNRLFCLHFSISSSISCYKTNIIICYGSPIKKMSREKVDWDIQLCVPRKGFMKKNSQSGQQKCTKRNWNVALAGRQQRELLYKYCQGTNQNVNKAPWLLLPLLLITEYEILFKFMFPIRCHRRSWMIHAEQSTQYLRTLNLFNFRVLSAVSSLHISGFFFLFCG